MPRLQPTVRQLQPLGRREHSAPIMDEHVDPRVHAADTSLPDLTTRARLRPRRRRWLPARVSPPA
jgi:hypothetical protein